MQYRSKSPDAFYEESSPSPGGIAVLDMYVVDNILDMGYLTTVLPRLIDSGYDLRFHVEIKSNLPPSPTPDPGRCRARVRAAGIESLNQHGAGPDGQGRQRVSERTGCCATLPIWTTCLVELSVRLPR